MARHRHTFGCLLLAIAMGGVIWYAADRVSLAEVARRERSLRDLIAAYPVRAWLVGWLVYYLAALVPGTRGKAIGFGWLFGFWPALVLVNLALTAAAQTAFLVSRYFVGEAVYSRYGAALYHVNRLLERDGGWYVLLLRVVPVSFSLTNYLLGATKVRTVTFWWATQLGLLPGNIVFVLVGAQLPSLSDVRERGAWALLSWDLIACLVLLSLFPLALHQLVRRIRPTLAQAPGVPHGGNI